MPPHPLALPNLRLVYWWTRRTGYRVETISREDRNQAAVLGFLEGLEKYDPERSSLSTYSQYLIRRALRRQAYLFRRVVAYPARGLYPKRKQYGEFLRGRITRDEFLSGTRVGLAADRDRERLLGLILGSDCSDAVLSETLEDYEAREDLERAELRTDDPVAKAAKLLSPREFDIVFRYVLAEETETFADIGRDYGVSRERIRQLYEGAMKALRASRQFEEWRA